MGRAVLAGLADEVPEALPERPSSRPLPLARSNFTCAMASGRARRENVESVVIDVAPNKPHGIVTQFSFGSI